MRSTRKKFHPALKHAGYSTTTILPGENPAEFKKLHQSLIEELNPSGPLEKDIVSTIARVVWRKQNLLTFRIAEDARQRSDSIRAEIVPNRNSHRLGVDEEKRILEEQRRELGQEYAFVELGDKATYERLETELEVEERLDATIERCLKRLLYVRGLKSLSTATTSPRREEPQLPSQKKVA
jgi:5-methylcytosine-specific restriction endonuclease McrBC regulatory subunit McrC